MGSRGDAICALTLLLVLVPALRFFLQDPQFSSLHKNQHIQIPIRPGNSLWISRALMPSCNIQDYDKVNNYFLNCLVSYPFFHISTSFL